MFSLNKEERLKGSIYLFLAGERVFEFQSGGPTRVVTDSLSRTQNDLNCNGLFCPQAQNVTNCNGVVPRFKISVFPKQGGTTEGSYIFFLG